MESSHAYEECHSSESGWTMYIGSPEHGDDDDDGSSSKMMEEEDDDGGNECTNKKISGNREDEESDDSMASDASSGPSYHRENMPRDTGECSSRYKKVVRVEEEVPKRRGCDRRRSLTKEEPDRREASGKVRMNLKFQMGKSK